MATDPYGFPSNDPTIASPSDPVAGGLTLAWALLSVVFALACMGCGGFIAANAEEPTVIDTIGVWLLASACAWPALGVAFWSVLLHLGVRRTWAQAGPNVLIGAITGSMLWFVVLCACAFAATA